MQKMKARSLIKRKQEITKIKNILFLKSRLKQKAVSTTLKLSFLARFKIQMCLLLIRTPQI